MLSIKEMQEIIKLCDFQLMGTTYSMTVKEDGRGSIYLQATYIDKDINTGKTELQHSRRWYLTPTMTKSEIVQTAFKMCVTSAEHITRESFLYRGKRVFGPHFNVDALYRICWDEDSISMRES